MQQVVGVMFTETTFGRILGFETNFDFWHVFWHKTENENACPETKLKPILWLILKKTIYGGVHMFDPFSFPVALHAVGVPLPPH